MKGIIDNIFLSNTYMSSNNLPINMTKSFDDPKVIY